MNNYTFTIIIPHKDTPQLLMRCLSSIPHRDDLQIIVVDDNSQDADNFILKYPLLSRSHVEFYSSKSGRGPGAARNYALDRARGKWIIFSDADDYFDVNTSDLLTQYANDDADVIFFNPRGVMSDNISVPSNRVQTYLQNNYDDFTVYKLSYLVPWGKMIKRALIEQNQLRMDEVRWSADVFFMCKIVVLAQRTKIDSRVLCVITERQDSLSYNIRRTNKVTIEESLCRANVYINCYNYVKQMGVYAENCKSIVFQHLLQIYRVGTWRDFCKMYRKIFPEYRKEIDMLFMKDLNIVGILYWKVLLWGSQFF